MNCRLSRRESRPIWRNTRSRSGKPSGNRKRRKNDRGGQLHSVMQLHYAIKLCATNKNRKDMWKSNKKTKQNKTRKISREANDTLFTEQQHLVQISNDINLAFLALFQAFFSLQWQLSNSGLKFGFSILIKFQSLDIIIKTMFVNALVICSVSRNQILIVDLYLEGRGPGVGVQRGGRNLHRGNPQKRRRAPALSRTRNLPRNRTSRPWRQKLSKDLVK